MKRDILQAELDKVFTGIYTAIGGKRLLQFKYSSEKKEGIRIIEPYILGINEGNYYISGYDTDLSIEEDKKHKNYILKNLQLKTIKVLS